MTQLEDFECNIFQYDVIYQDYAQKVAKLRLVDGKLDFVIAINFLPFTHNDEFVAYINHHNDLLDEYTEFEISLTPDEELWTFKANEEEEKEFLAFCLEQLLQQELTTKEAHFKKQKI